MFILLRHNGHFDHGIKGAYELPTEALQKAINITDQTPYDALCGPGS
jgi:hypothetical protein